ncbi:hypothetical protein DIS24_g4849 [Lasiodiplodia hormozganensis]|uniref:Protein-lysine N-methyltransferase EFM2 n=1 Tax=Lasiodiplodia hormozganensis TaxID=869390 RepID=A0AA39YT84_9PEZI|nr:hypothetical protein DIS24_g4849 [Lasiodiplodia hormozganensis]
MSYPGHCLPPTSSLPPVRSLHTLSEQQISSALGNLHYIYCPLRLPRAFKPHGEPKRLLSVPPTPADSGYASNNEDDDEEEALASLRADAFERNFTVRWLTAFIARAEELDSIAEDTRMKLIDEAAFVLASFNDDVKEDDDVDDGITRNFSFSLPPLPAPAPSEIEVHLNDAPLSGTDHTDVGLQSWGASIVLSDMMCASPARFGLEPSQLGPSPTIVELGAGTGLVSLMLAKLLPHLYAGQQQSTPTIVATDYHPAVLENLKANIATNFPASSSSSPSSRSSSPSSSSSSQSDDLPATPAPVQTRLLDWSDPSPALSQAPLDVPARLLVAADVVYAPEHAVWLRDCAGRMLCSSASSVFWLIATARPKSNRFAPLVDTVEAAFADPDACPRSADGSGARRLGILGVERLEKRSGVGRGDEGYYKLYRIGWM